MERRYHNITVHPSINCSSTGHYTAYVTFDDHYARKSYTYLIDDGQCINQRGDNWIQLPRYVIDTIKDQLRTLGKDGKLRVYEVNRDQVPRYADLRYHDEAYFKRLIGIKDKTP